jgi:hypothetical protein
MLDILLSIDELVRESAGIKIEEVTQQAVNGNIVVDLAIAAEKIVDKYGLVPTGSSERLHAAERLVLDILLSIDELVHESEGLKIQDRTQKKIRDKIVVDMQIVAEEIEPVEAVFERLILYLLGMYISTRYCVVKKKVRLRLVSIYRKTERLSDC